MKELQMTLPEVGLIAGTRAAFGLGLGLIVADWFQRSPRRAVGWTLLLVGAITTVPLIMNAMGKCEDHTSASNPAKRATLDDEQVRMESP